MDFQGHGLGTRIIQDVIAAAYQRGIPVALNVNRVNPAHRLYERLGVVETGQTDHMTRWWWHHLRTSPVQPEESCPELAGR